MRQVRNRCGVPQVHVDAQKGSAGCAEKGDNAKKRKLNLHCNCLQAAAVDVKLPEEA